MADFDVRKVVDNVGKLIKGVGALAGSDVLVGVPASKAVRRGGGIGNADLAYIHENGSPTHNIPARPFLKPGIRKVRGDVTAILRQAAKDALMGGGNVDAAFSRVGMLARNAVVEAITDPDPPFEPLKAATIRARLRKTQAGRRQLKRMAADARQSGQRTADALLDWAGAGNAKPLIDSGQLRASISYVVRKG